jgi:Ni/Co efflux regulator RcnB
MHRLLTTLVAAFFVLTAGLSTSATAVTTTGHGHHSTVHVMERANHHNKKHKKAKHKKAKHKTTKHACTRTSSGSCIRGGQFCPQASYGQTGWDADNRHYTCKGDHTHPHWER